MHVATPVNLSHVTYLTDCPTATWYGLFNSLGKSLKIDRGPFGSLWTPNVWLGLLKGTRKKQPLEIMTWLTCHAEIDHKILLWFWGGR